MVNSTKHRKKTLLKENRTELFNDIWGILKNKKCHLYRVGGIEDHIHIAFSLHPTVSLSNLVKDIKLGSFDFIKEQAIFPDFKGWQDGYAAFSVSESQVEKVVEYIRNQEEHHRQRDFKSELIELLRRHGIEFNEQYLWD